MQLIRQCSWGHKQWDYYPDILSGTVLCSSKLVLNIQIVRRYMFDATEEFKPICN